jgi:hypothetical protein
MTIQVANVTTAGNTVYTSSGNTAITFLSLCNYGNADVMTNLYVVPSGGTAGNACIVLAELLLTASGNGTGDTYQLYAGGEKLLLGNGDFVSVIANANTVTTVTSFTTI